MTMLLQNRVVADYEQYLPTDVKQPKVSIRIIRNDEKEFKFIVMVLLFHTE